MSESPASEGLTQGSGFSHETFAQPLGSWVSRHRPGVAQSWGATSAGGLTESLHRFLYCRAGLRRAGWGRLPLGCTGCPCLPQLPAPPSPSSPSPRLRASVREGADVGRGSIMGSFAEQSSGEGRWCWLAPRPSPWRNFLSKRPTCGCSETHGLRSMYVLLAPTPAPALFRQSVGLPLGLLFGDSSLPGGGTLSGTEWAPDPPETTLQGYGPFMSSVEPRAEPGKGGGSKAQPG